MDKVSGFDSASYITDKLAYFRKTFSDEISSNFLILEEERIGSKRLSQNIESLLEELRKINEPQEEFILHIKSLIDFIETFGLYPAFLQVMLFGYCNHAFFEFDTLDRQGFVAKLNKLQELVKIFSESEVKDKLQVIDTYLFDSKKKLGLKESVAAFRINIQIPFEMQVDSYLDGKATEIELEQIIERFLLFIENGDITKKILYIRTGEYGWAEKNLLKHDLSNFCYSYVFKYMNGEIDIINLTDHVDRIVSIVENTSVQQELEKMKTFLHHSDQKFDRFSSSIHGIRHIMYKQIASSAKQFIENDGDIDILLKKLVDISTTFNVINSSIESMSNDLGNLMKVVSEFILNNFVRDFLEAGFKNSELNIENITTRLDKINDIIKSNDFTFKCLKIVNSNGEGILFSSFMKGKIERFNSYFNGEISVEEIL